MMKNKKYLLLLLPVFVIIVISYFINFSRSNSYGSIESGGKSEKSYFNILGLFSGFNTRPSITNDMDEDTFVSILKERYSNKLSRKRIQVRLIGGLMRFLKRKYPDNWRDKLNLIIREDFPQYASQLFAYTGKVEEYSLFIRNKQQWIGLSIEERREKIWEKREEIFGNEYEEIWGYELRKDKVDTLLVRLNENNKLSFNEKINLYRKSVKNIFTADTDETEGRTEDDIMVRQINLTNKFLGLQSIQDELDEMTKEEREMTLRELRQSMGMSEDTLTKMEETDRIRDKLYANGTKYMIERSAVITMYSGEARDKKLNEIREKYFGENSSVIKYEEDSMKVFRFNQSRKWGRD